MIGGVDILNSSYFQCQQVLSSRVLIKLQHLIEDLLGS